MAPRRISEPFDDVRPPLRIHVVATDHNVSVARRRFRDWLVFDVSSNLLDDLVLVVHEAMANAVEHGYAEQPGGPVRLHARRGRGQVLITVSDEGRWRAPTGERYRGHGLPLMRLLTHDVDVVTGPGGTVVRLWAETAPASLTSPG
ncbi:MAG: ATP-binding protein [Pseudonocardiaceae bacterium]